MRKTPAFTKTPLFLAITLALSAAAYAADPIVPQGTYGTQTIEVDGPAVLKPGAGETQTLNIADGETLTLVGKVSDLSSPYLQTGTVIDVRKGSLTVTGGNLVLSRDDFRKRFPNNVSIDAQNQSIINGLDGSSGGSLTFNNASTKLEGTTPYGIRLDQDVGLTAKNGLVINLDRSQIGGARG